MKSPLIPVSWGELIDKITILQIKLGTLKSGVALSNVEREYKQLRSIYSENLNSALDLQKLEDNLKIINQQLWNIEDKIREREKIKLFDEEFIQLARSVYIKNDERARIKKQINEVCGSELFEEKSYTDY